MAIEVVPDDRAAEVDRAAENEKLRRSPLVD